MPPNASDTLPEDAWANAFNSASTRPVLNALSRRLQASNTHVHALSELYRERAVIEQEYSTKLAKLARSAEAGQLSGKGSVEWERHSAEAKLFDAVVADLQETSSVHSTLSAMLKSDFEQPVRDLPNKVASWRRIHDQEASLDRTLKDYEKTSGKLEKATAKKGSSKADQLSADLGQITSSLASLTPMVYTTFQKLDEERLRSLKEIVVRWATARADMATKDGERAEGSLTKLLSWETDDEVTSAGLRIASACGGRPGARSNTVNTVNTTAGASSVSSTPARRMSVHTTGTSGTADFGPRKANGSTHTVSSTTGGGGGGGFSGIKSMLTRKATVAGRQRSGSEAPSMRSTTRRPTDEMFSPLEEGEDESRSAGQQPPSIHRQHSDRPGGDVRPQTSGPPPPVDEEGFSIAPADRHRNPWEDPTELVPIPPAPSAAAPAATREVLTSSSTANGVSLPSAIFAEQRSASPDASQPSSAAGSIDGGPARLNLALSSTPIKEDEAERKAALAKMQQTLQMAPGAPMRRTTIARGRREARHTIQASPTENSPVSPEHMRALAQLGEDEEHLQNVSPTNTLSVRQDVIRKTSLSSLSSSRNPFESPALGSSAPTFNPTISSTTVTPQVAGAAGAALAGTAALGTAALRHSSTGADPAASAGLSATPTEIQSPATKAAAAVPTATTTSINVAPGLRATMVETVHAFIRQFASQRTVVTGEVHVSLAASTSRALPPAGSALHIRLTEFDALESVSPNPAFLVQVPDSPGEYYLNTDALAQATTYPETGEGLGPVLFKYHVLVPEGAETTVAPLILNPAFQIKNGETRMILHYRAQGSTTSDLGLAVTFPESPAVTTTQSKPVSGVWGAPADGSDGHQISWSLEEAKVGAEGKIVARFLTAAGSGQLAPTSVNAHFVVPNHLISGLGIEIVDGEGKEPPTLHGWSFDDVSRSTVSGTYVGDVNLNP